MLILKYLKWRKSWWKISNLILNLHSQLIKIIFSDENDSESQDIENDSISQESQRKYMINKTQEVRVDEKFEDDSDYGQSIKEKS